MKSRPLFYFVLQLLLFAVLLFAVDRGVGFAVINLKNIGLSRNPETNKTAFVAEKVDASLLVIGSSKASHHYLASMISDSLRLSAYNCGQDGCFFLYQNTMLNIVLDRYNPRTIVWDFMPGCLAEDSKYEEYQECRNFSPYYGENQWATTYIDSQSDFTHYKFKSLAFSYNSSIFKFLQPMLLSKDANAKGYSPLPCEGYEYPTLSQRQEPEGKSSALNRRYVDLLQQTLHRCQSQGVDLIVCISPEYKTQSSSYLELCQQIGRIVKKSGAIYYDYTLDAQFLSDASLFKDADHLNDAGARLYTQSLIQRIRNEEGMVCTIH